MSQKTLSQQNMQCSPENLIFIQSRAEINLSIVDEYAQMMRDGVIFDPVEGVQGENGQIYIHDGYHRGEAAKKVGMTLLVNLKPGTKIEAEWLALAANQKHGLRRTTQDKQRIIRKALLHPTGASLSNREIARHCGVNDKTVGKIRREMEVSAEIPQIEKRIVSRSGVTYEQDTHNIGHISSTERQKTVPKPTGQPFQRNDDLPAGQPNGDYAHLNNVRINGTMELDLEDRHHVDSTDEAGEYKPKAQEFECPRCGQEKIVGVNGSRRWCLGCEAQWATAEEFLAEFHRRQEESGRQEIGSLLQSQQPTAGDLTIAPTPTTTEPPQFSTFENPQVVTRQSIQSRFLDILTQLEEQDKQLVQIDAWLDDLEHRLVFPENNGTAELVTWPMPSQILENT